MNFTENEIKFMICDVVIDNVDSPAHVLLARVFGVDPDRVLELIQFCSDSIHAGNVALKTIAQPDDPESLR